MARTSPAARRNRLRPIRRIRERLVFRYAHAVRIKMETAPHDKRASKFSGSCKVFRKKNALAFFILIIDPDSGQLKHREMIRLVNPKADEYYLIPRPLDKSDFHISYHKSGAFHWKLNRILQLPKEREKDFRDAFCDYILMQSFFGWIVGYCIACDARLSKTALRSMLKILAPYIPIPGVDSEAACDDIYERKHVTKQNNAKSKDSPVQLYPLASGLALVELKEAIGILHTLNVSVTDNKEIIFHRRTPNGTISSFEFAEVSKDKIQATHFVLI